MIYLRCAWCHPTNTVDSEGSDDWVSLPVCHPIIHRITFILFWINPSDRTEGSAHHILLCPPFLISCCRREFPFQSPSICSPSAFSPPFLVMLPRLTLSILIWAFHQADTFTHNPPLAKRLISILCLALLQIFQSFCNNIRSVIEIISLGEILHWYQFSCFSYSLNVISKSFCHVTREMSAVHVHPFSLSQVTCFES